jgi:hypothetical protein
MINIQFVCGKNPRKEKKYTQNIYIFDTQNKNIFLYRINL